jgi:hypothetical protein
MDRTRIYCLLSRASELIFKGERPKGGPRIKCFNYRLEVIKERKMSRHQTANCKLLEN